MFIVGVLMKSSCMLFISFYTYCFRLKVDLGKVQAVSKTETQGYGYDQWVKTLHLNYSIDGPRVEDVLRARSS